MAKIILIVFSLILFMGNGQALVHKDHLLTGGGDHVGNGGGLSESNFAFARLHLRSFITLCLNSSQCISSSNEIKIAKQVLTNLDQELKNENQLIVISEVDHPGFFYLDHNTRIAKTGNTIGDPIYLNRDLLYEKKDGKVLTIDIPQAIAILFHEFGHHTGEMNHDLLDAIGAKIGFNAAKQSYTLSNYLNDVVLPSTKDVLLQVVTYIEAKGKERLVLKGKDQSIDLTDVMANELRAKIEESCSSISTDICSTMIGMENGTYPLKSLYFSDASWEKIVAPTLDGRFIWIKLSIDFAAYHSVKPVSSYYHLKGRAQFLIKLDRLKHHIQHQELSAFNIAPYFGHLFE